MQSSAENDDRVITLAREVLLMPAAEREEFLRMKCKDEGDLYSQVAEVVEWEQRMGGFLAEPLIKYIDLEEESPPQQVLKPGETISDRFHIMREVGRGGMGIVYEAFDRKRNKRIAIKCAQPGFGRLLSPELEGALRVRHPNICLVNEIHTTMVPEHGELDFLTMEYLEGETLAARLKRDGKLPALEALAVGRQLCAGVGAAHEAGVLHRDLKPGNVILATNEDGSTRAVITDFGLATEARLEGELEGGTPQYMAPELWDGEKPSKASDVYALGVILYEMATGNVPFPDELRSAPSPPTAINADLDTRWGKAVLPCLRTTVAERPSAADVLQALDKKPIWKSPVLAVAVLAVLALLAGFRQQILGLFKPADIRLAILPLEAPAELQELGNSVLQDVTERIKRSQRGTGTLVVIGYSDASRNNVQTPEQARQVLNATHALRLRLTRAENRLVSEESIIALDTSATLGSLKGTYTDSTAGALPEALAGEARLALKLRSNSPDHLSQDATPAYDHGLYALRSGRYSLDEALTSFRDAAKLDPLSPLPLAGMAETQVRKFDLTKDSMWLDEAASSVLAAEALNPDSVNVRLAAGSLNESRSQYLRALEDYHRVLELEPRNVDAYVRMGRTYDLANMQDKAVESYQRAVMLDPNYYLPYQWLGVFYYRHGKHQQAAEQFQNAINHAPGLYDAYTNLGAALDSLGRDPEAERALNRSLELRETARALNSLGAVLAYEGRDSEARQKYERAVALEPGNYLYWLNLGDSERRLGRSGNASREYKKGHDLATAELRQNPARAYVRAFVAYFKARLGQRTAAEQDIAEALQLSPDDNEVIRCAVLTFQALGDDERALLAVGKASPGMIAELSRHPDLSDFRKNPRFVSMLTNSKPEVN